MSETSESTAPATTGTATPAPAATAGSAPAAGTTPAAGASTGKGTAADKAASQAPAPKGIQAAFARAQKRTADAKAKAPSTAGGEQAPASGASTPAAGATATTEDKPTAGAPETGKPAAQGGGTVEAPKDWPQTLRDRFNTLPDPARQTVLDIQRDFQRGFQSATEKIAQTEKRYADLITTAERYEREPKKVIADLARQAGIEIFFERPLPAGAVPEFKSPAEMAEWVTQQVAERVEKDLTAQTAKRDAERRKGEAEQQLKAELAQAVKEHKDFDTHKAAVFDLLASTPGLRVQDAYKLATYDALRGIAGEAEKAKTELAALKQQIETEKKKLTAPVQGAAGAAPVTNNDHLSPAQRAYQRAQTRMRSQAATG